MGHFGNAAKAAAAICCAAHLGGCGIVPEFGSMAEPAQITDVVQRVECEIYDTVQAFKNDKKTKWIVDYQAKVTLQLTVSQDGSVSPDISLLGPFLAGSYVLGAGGSLKGATERLATYAFTIKFKHYQKFSEVCSDPSKQRLHGTLGFSDWIGRVLVSKDKDDSFVRPTDLTHKLDFQIDAGLKITPAYELLRSRGNSALAANISFKHAVDFVLTYNDPDAEDFEKVCVVNMPGPCYDPRTKVASKSGGGSSRAVRQRLDNLGIDLQIRSLRIDQLRR